MIHFYCKGYFLPTKFVIFYDLQARQFFLTKCHQKSDESGVGNIYIYKKGSFEEKRGQNIIHFEEIWKLFFHLRVDRYFYHKGKNKFRYVMLS